MSNDLSLFASHVERVEFTGRALQRIMAEKGARFCLKLNANRIALSKVGGCLLGESLADHLSVSGNIVVTFQRENRYFIISYGKDGVISEFMNVAWDDYLLLLAGACVEKETLFVCCEADELLPICGGLFEVKDLDIKRIEPDSIDSYFSKVISGGAIKFSLHRPKREKSAMSPPMIMGGVALLVAAVFLMRNSGEEEKPVDPYASYKMEMSGVKLSSAIEMAISAVKSSLDVSTWKIDTVSVDAIQTTILFTPVLSEGVMKEMSEWCKRKGYSYIMSPEGVLVSIANPPLLALDSNKIQDDIKGSVELVYDALNKLSMFRTVISPVVNKGNFNVIPVAFSGEGMIVEEVSDLAKLMANFPVKAESVKLKSTDVEYVFDVSIAATAIGE